MWHKPTVEETESGMEVTSYLPAELDPLNPSLLILGNRNGGPADSGVAVSLLRIAWQTLGSGKPLPKLPVQIFLIWYPDRFHPRVMRLSSRLSMLK